MEYLVKWKEYPKSENLWEPCSNLENAQQALEEFHCNHPDLLTQVQQA